MRAGRYPEDHPLEILARQKQFEQAMAKLKPDERKAAEPVKPAPKREPARSRW